MLWRAYVGSARVNFKPQGAHPRLKRAQSRPERGPLKVKWAKNDQFSFFGRGPTRPGGPFVTNFTPVARALAAPLDLNKAQKPPN